jgi:hypothetical protein
MAMWVFLCLGTAAALFAQGPGVHYLHQGAMPPGAIGSRQLQRGGPLPGYFQPVEIKAPDGALISLASQGAFTPPQQAPLKAGLLIGQVYRLKVMKIPLNPGMEVFPTVEIIDRLYAPVDQQQRFPIPIELTREDLQLALSGKFVTRVIYLEDPRQALPVTQDPSGQHWFEVGAGKDPLAEADALGRPVAILRLGARLPDNPEMPDDKFLYGCPPYVQFVRGALPQAAVAPQPKAKSAPTPAVKPEGKVEPDAAAEPKVKVLPPPPDRETRRTTPAVPNRPTR